MSRSNKEARLNHSGMTIETGHGGLKRNAMGSAAKKVSVSNKDAEETSGKKSTEARKAKIGAMAAAAAKSLTPEESESESGWDKIGDAGASIAKTYKTNRAAKNKKKASSGSGGAKA